MKRKRSVGLAIAVVLILLVATALAVVTLRESARTIAQTEQDSGSFGFWPVEKKIEVVTMLADQGLMEETDALKQMREGALSEEEASRAADALIEAFTGWKAVDVGFMVIMQAAWGPFDTWSDADRAWYSALMEDVGAESDARTVYVLPDGEISREEAAAIATEAILEGVGMEESALEGYNVIVNFQVPEFAEAGDEQPWWYVMVEAKENSPDNPFSAMELFIHPQTGELLESVEELLERKAGMPKRPDNALYRAIDAYRVRAEAMGAYGFDEWPLELRAEYSGEIAPQVQAILESGDWTELMNCGRADLEVIAQSACVYGLPDETAISQEAACEAAKAALTEAYGLPAGHFSKYESCYVYYDVTDTPLWRFVFNPKTLDVRQLGDGYDDPMLNRCFRAEIDAHTGEVVHIEEFAFQLSGYDLDYKLKWY